VGPESGAGGGFGRWRSYDDGHEQYPTTPASALPRWPSRFWAQASAHDFALAQSNGLAADTVAVLPVAAVEQHGPHLPLSVDASLIEGVIDAALAQLPPSCRCCFCRRRTSAFRSSIRTMRAP
jgi:creatinine amidohydrolase